MRRQTAAEAHKGSCGSRYRPRRTSAILSSPSWTKTEPHALVFPCRRVPGGWINAKLRKWIDVRPTHWREWVEKL
jgi:hypothetical protein